jgi:hypothetical protein
VKRGFRFAVLICFGFGCALLLRGGLQAPTYRVSTAAAPAAANAGPNDVSVSLPRQFTYNGVHYSLPFGDGRPPSMYVFQVNSDEGYRSRTPRVLHSHDGRLYLAGKSYGKVEQGDKVEVTTSGGVFINGKERFAGIAL